MQKRVETDLCEGAQLDAKLLQEAANGDPLALGMLYDRHAGRLLSVAYYILRDRNDAEDLVHDVFVEAWQKAASYDPTRASVRSWLMLRIRSRAIDRLRQRELRPTSIETTRMPEPAVAADGPNGLVERAQAVSALATLPRAHRTVLELSFFHGLSCRAIAQLHELPEGTVKSRLAAGINKLRDALRIAPGEMD